MTCLGHASTQHSRIVTNLVVTTYSPAVLFRAGDACQSCVPGPLASSARDLARRQVQQPGGHDSMQRRASVTGSLACR